MNAQNPLPPDPVEVHPADACPVDARRKRARRTALWVAGITALFYLGFIALLGLTQ